MKFVLFFMRWGHFLAGIMWIGLLYSFNMVNAKFLSFTNSNFMGSIDAETKVKIYPSLMTKALWWFRWGALWTVVFGLIMYGIYFPQYLTRPGTLKALWIELALLAVIYFLNFYALRLTAEDKNKPFHNLMIFFVIVTWIYSVAAPYFMNADSWITTITFGGGLGILMMANVWSVIWPKQQKIIQSFANQGQGKPPLPDVAKLSKVAGVASRTNTWLSIPMLFGMAAASHLPLP